MIRYTIETLVKDKTSKIDMFKCTFCNNSD